MTDDEAFEKHLAAHFASLVALQGAQGDYHYHMIISALQGTWRYAIKYQKEKDNVE